MTLRLSRTVVAWIRDEYVRRYLPAMLMGGNMTIDAFNADMKMNMTMGVVNAAKDYTCEEFIDDYYD